MGEFIRYCLRCFLMVICIAFGSVPEEATFKSVLVGCATGVVLLGLVLGYLWIYSTIDKISERKK